MDKKTDVRDPDEKVVEIEMERLRAFPNHPFKVKDDDNMNILNLLMLLALLLLF